MKKYFTLLIIFFIVGAIYSQNSGKRPSRYGFDINFKPRIYYDIYFSKNFSNRKPVLNLLLNIQNDLLQFTKNNNHYSASYEISFTLRKKENKEFVFSEIWQNNLIETDFEKTNSINIYNTEVKSFPIDTESGKYEIYLEIVDRKTSNVYKSTRDIVLKKIKPDSLNVSDIKLLNPTDSLSLEIPLDEKTIIEFNNTPVASFEIETNESDSLIVNSKLFFKEKNKNKLLSDKKFRYLPQKSYFTFAELLPPELLNEGNYSLKYKIYYGSKFIEKQKDFEIVWFGKPAYMYKYDLALRPLKYVISEDEWKTVDKLSNDEQEVWYQQYWKKSDPTPETPFNEIQFEFYNRVEIANKEYSSRFKEGWETDRGKTIILYGKPDEKQIHKFTKNAPYEIWIYKKLKRKLTFVDVYNDDTYKLIGVEDLEE